MPSKLALILLLVSLLALFDIGLTFPTNALSLQTLERAADAEPAVNDLVERTDKPAEFDKYIECVDQIHECDILKEAHHFTTWYVSNFPAKIQSLNQLTIAFTQQRQRTRRL
jgi:hypothetical protein